MALMNAILFYLTTRISAPRGHFSATSGGTTLVVIPLVVSRGPRDLV